MLKRNGNYEVDQRIIKVEYIGYSLSEMATINTPNSRMFINIPREDSAFSPLNSSVDLNFEVIQKSDTYRYANGNDIRLVNLGTFAFFSNVKLTTSSGKHLEDISHAHIVSVLYRLTNSSNDFDDFSFGFDRSRGRRKLELTSSKTHER